MHGATHPKQHYPFRAMQTKEHAFNFFFNLFIYDRHTVREREAETQAEGEAGSMQGARHGTRSRVSRTTPWAEGRRQTTEPPGLPEAFLFKKTIFIFMYCHLSLFVSSDSLT